MSCVYIDFTFILHVGLYNFFLSWWFTFIITSDLCLTVIWTHLFSKTTSAINPNFSIINNDLSRGVKINKATLSKNMCMCKLLNLNVQMYYTNINPFIWPFLLILTMPWHTITSWANLWNDLNLQPKLNKQNKLPHIRLHHGMDPHPIHTPYLFKDPIDALGCCPVSHLVHCRSMTHYRLKAQACVHKNACWNGAAC